MRLSAVFHALRDAPAQDLHLAAGTALTFGIRMLSYVLTAATGIVVARALGAHGRGVYALAVTIAYLFPSLASLGVSWAGVYFVGHKRCSLQEMISNNLVFWLSVSCLWITGVIVFALVRPESILPEFRFSYFLILALGGAILLLSAFAKDISIASGSVLGYNAVDLSDSVFRTILIASGVLVLGLGVGGVLSAWLLAICFTGVLGACLIAKRGRLKLAGNLSLFKKQLTFGLRGYLGYVLQTANYRLDVFFVAAFAGSSTLGQYTVAFGTAEMLWQLPMTLGEVLYPKLSALDSEANTDTAVATCRRVLFITLIGLLLALASGRFLIGFLYGSEYLPAVNVFYILVPSVLLYTIHKVLGSSLSGNGMPEVNLYGGGASVLVTIGLDLLLIPRMGMEGAAIASVAAYAVNAGVILSVFLYVTRRSPLEILLVRRSDILDSFQLARAFLARGQA